MIVKKVKCRQSAKPKAWQIGDLVDYIRHPRNVNSLEKIEHSGSRNFFGTTHAGQKGEMIGLASESVHSRMPVAHWIFSWKENEQPSAEQVDEVVDIFLEKMGLVGHQVIYGLHYNTENYHVHIAVNRMNPETMKVIRPNNGFDIVEAHKILALIEHKQGWSSENNARYAVNSDGEIVPRPKQENTPKPKTAALDFECATGEKSAQRIAQERGLSLMKDAKTWEELHRKLAEVGLRFEKKGSGAIVFVGEVAVKASSVDRSLSLKNLCKKLGEFEPGEYALPLEKIEPEPVSSVNLEEWKQYRAERAEAAKPPPPVMENLAFAVMGIRHRQERKNLVDRLAKHGFSVLNIARHCLKERQREEMRKLREKWPKPKRRKIPRFETWLRTQGLTRQADHWRYRNRPLPETALRPPAAPPGNSLAAYAAHRQAVQKDAKKLSARIAALSLFQAAVPKVDIPETPSRVDALIALRMRSTGHSREDVADTIRHCDPKERGGEKRDWNRYAERTVAYAFGVPGDVELAKSDDALQAQWRRIEGSIEGVAEARPEAAPAAPRMRMR